MAGLSNGSDGGGITRYSVRIGATEEMIAHGYDGFLVAQRDSDGLFSLIDLLARDLDLRERTGRNARETAERRFDVQKSSGMLLEAIYVRAGGAAGRCPASNQVTTSSANGLQKAVFGNPNICGGPPPLQ